MHAGNPEVSKNRRMMKPLATELEIPLWGARRAVERQIVGNLRQINIKDGEPSSAEKRFTAVKYTTCGSHFLYLKREFAFNSTLVNRILPDALVIFH